MKKLEFDYDEFPLSVERVAKAAGVELEGPIADWVKEERPLLRPEFEGRLIISPRFMFYDATPMSMSFMAGCEEICKEVSDFRIIVKNRPKEIGGFRFPWQKRKEKVNRRSGDG